MSTIVIYDPLDPTVPNRVTQLRRSVNTPDFVGDPNTLINPTITASLAVRYWKYNGADAVVDMSNVERASLDAANVIVAKAAQDVDDDRIFDAYERAAVRRR